jgi:tetratricopeptide (TPR) repeat protein
VRFLHGFSAGEFFESLLPVASLLAAVLSAWVLASSRRCGLPIPAVAAWTFGTLLAPPVVFPAYLIYRLFLSKGSKSAAAANTSAVSPEDRGYSGLEVTAQHRLKMRWSLPILYLLLLLAINGALMYREYQSVDSHLARANAARLKDQPDQTVLEYRRALALEDNPHTHNLLGCELVEKHRWAEAIVELRAAQRGGEPDQILPYNLGVALREAGNLTEAKLEFEEFLASSACTAAMPDARCDAAKNAIYGK